MGESERRPSRFIVPLKIGTFVAVDAQAWARPRRQEREDESPRSPFFLWCRLSLLDLHLLPETQNPRSGLETRPPS